MPRQKIYVGPRGGKYILKGGQKRYFSGGMPCSKLRKTKEPKCEEQADCQWVVGKGCRSSKGKKQSSPPSSKKKPARRKNDIRSITRTRSSRTWLGGVLKDDQFLDTTAANVKKAIKLLIPKEVPVVEVRRYKDTKFFTIELAWEKTMKGRPRAEDVIDEIGVDVDFYFDEDQHNQSIGHVFEFPKTEVVLEIMDPWLNYGRPGSINIANAEKNLQTLEKTAKPKTKIVCDGNKCRRVPAKKKQQGKKKKKPPAMYKSVNTKGHGTTMRLVARTYAEEARGEDGDICNIRPLLSRPDFRKLIVSTNKKTGKPTYKWSKSIGNGWLGIDSSCKVSYRDYR